MTINKKAYFVLLLIVIVFLLQPKGGTWAYLLNVRWLYVFLVAFCISNFLTPVCIKLGYRFNLLDYPSERKTHKEPTPRIGGIAIYLAFIICIVRNLQFSKELSGLVIASSMIFFLSLIDDFHPLSATLRIIVQVAAALLAVKSGLTITFLPVGFPGEYFFEALITIIWFIGITNAVNFLDGIDGLVTSFGILCSLLFFLIALPTQQKFLVYLCIALIGACVGFIPYNWHRAKIFLGDSGSTFIGFLLGGFAVFGSWAEHNPIVALSTPLLILSIPIFDMIYTTISRIRNRRVKTVKEWLEYTARDHFHHRLMKLGLSVPKSVGFIILVNSCLGLGALIIRDVGTKGSILLLLQATGIFAIIVVLMILGREITP
ncbi:MAG: MraY family glycosyltransferase [Elusimicrobiota bacterium]|nr:MraY family glycosyltransferase [Elusimicrobiota bacterium]